MTEEPLTTNPIDTPLTTSEVMANTTMDMDEQEATLVDVRVTIENFTTTTVGQPAVFSTPKSHSIQLYEPQTTLGKQVIQLLGDKKLAHKFDKLRTAAKACEKGERTHQRYE